MSYLCRDGIKFYGFTILDILINIQSDNGHHLI